MSPTSCKTGTSWVLPLTPLDRITVVWLTVEREVSVSLSHGWLWKCDHIQKDALSPGNSPGINFKANGQLFFLLFDNWSYKIILVPGPRTKLFDVRNLVLPYMKMQVLVEFFSCPTIYKIPETCPPSAFRCVVFSLIAVPNSEVATDTPSHVPPRRRGIIIAIFHDFGTNSMVLYDYVANVANFWEHIQIRSFWFNLIHLHCSKINQSKLYI